MRAEGNFIQKTQKKNWNDVGKQIFEKKNIKNLEMCVITESGID